MPRKRRNRVPVARPHERLLTQKEAAEQLRIGVGTLKVWRRTGKIPFLRLGYRSVRIRQSDLDQFVEGKSR